MNSGASVIIVTFNSSSTIANCLGSVVNTLRPQDEVLVIDNHSQDNTLEIIEQLNFSPEKVKVLPQSKNYGFSRGCNIGIENSNKEFVILLNPDTEVFGDWIAKLTGHFQYYENTGAVGALSNATIPVQHISTYFQEYDLYNAQEIIACLSQNYDKRSIPSKLLIGFCMALRRDLLERFGGLDEDIFLGDDDTEISWRLREKGYLLRIALDVYVNHFNHVSFNTLENSETDKIVQEGTDVLYEKMKAYYSPEKVPNPNDYFGISWWKPSILKNKSEDEVFAPRWQRHEYNDILLKANDFLKNQNYLAAIDVLRDALNLHVNDFNFWYTLGSVHLMMKEYGQAEVALKNAETLEFNGERAKQKLAKLHAEHSDMKLNDDAIAQNNSIVSS